MKPKYHIICGALFSICLFLIFNYLQIPITTFQLLIIFFSSVLIDVDHYAYYVFIKKNFNLIKAYNWFVRKRKKWIRISIEERKKYKNPILIFHGIEFWILLLILSFYYKPFWFILIGVFFHLFLDYIDLIYYHEF